MRHTNPSFAIWPSSSFGSPGGVRLGLVVAFAEATKKMKVEGCLKNNHSTANASVSLFWISYSNFPWASVVRALSVYKASIESTIFITSQLQANSTNHQEASPPIQSSSLKALCPRRLSHTSNDPSTNSFLLVACSLIQMDHVRTVTPQRCTSVAKESVATADLITSKIDL